MGVMYLIAVIKTMFVDIATFRGNENLTELWHVSG